MKQFLLFTVLFLAACGGPMVEPAAYPVPDAPEATAELIAYPEPITDPTTEPMSDQYTPATGEYPLTLDQPAAMPDGATITLIRLEDSRCPPDVTCVWEGELSIEVMITTADGRTETLQLTTLTATASALLDDHLLQVVSAEPRPLSTEAITADKYELVISRQIAGTGAYIDSLDVLLMESFPLQASARLVGNLADGCTSLVDVQVVRQDNQFTLTPITSRPADMMCTQALVPFEQNVLLDILGLPAGTYTVVVGDLSAKFILEMDNVLTLDPLTPIDKLGSGSADVSDVFIELGGDTVVAIVTGFLADGCTNISEVKVEQTGNTFNVALMVSRPPDLNCTMALRDYTHRIELAELANLSSGSYTVNVNGVTAKFDVP